jgi:hypothetical protein
VTGQRSARSNRGTRPRVRRRTRRSVLMHWSLRNRDIRVSNTCSGEPLCGSVWCIRCSFLRAGEESLLLDVRVCCPYLAHARKLVRPHLAAWGCTVRRLHAPLLRLRLRPHRQQQSTPCVHTPGRRSILQACMPAPCSRRARLHSQYDSAGWALRPELPPLRYRHPSVFASTSAGPQMPVRQRAAEAAEYDALKT